MDTRLDGHDQLTQLSHVFFRSLRFLLQPGNRVKLHAKLLRKLVSAFSRVAKLLICKKQHLLWKLANSIAVWNHLFFAGPGAHMCHDVNRSVPSTSMQGSKSQPTVKASSVI